jgi:hypothetical protein
VVDGPWGILRILIGTECFRTVLLLGPDYGRLCGPKPWTLVSLGPLVAGHSRLSLHPGTLGTR